MADRNGAVKPRGRAAVELMLAVLVPAAVAGLLAFVLIPESGGSAPAGSAGDARAEDLARRAGSLKPIVVDTRGARLGSSASEPSEQGARPAPPRRISIPAVDVNAGVEPVGRTPSGIAVPAVGRAGWYRDGPRPGEPGRSVVIGHLDSSNGPGLFALLPGVANGTKVSMVDAAGKSHDFAVVGKAQVEKQKFPAQAVYGPSDRPVLVLVTCGGPYTPGVGYRDNVIVYARSVGA
jgi:sortase (surface protein transpeptidase)